MANRFFNPNEQFCDPTGTPYAGGSLSFFASGTSAPLNTYQDPALSIANTNPVVLDSAGRANSIFLQNLAYKVVLADVNSNQIWTEDPVWSSDFSTQAAVATQSGSPNGNRAGTAGAGTTPASMVYDVVGQILYVCTQTGNSATAVWTAINASTSAAVNVEPQGRLTLQSATPVMNSDVTSVSAVLYTPYFGNICPIYNGSVFVPTSFTEQTLTLVASHTANTAFDVFAFNNSGVFTIGTGPAWTNSGAGVSARGSGGGTTQLSRLNGLLVNAVSATLRNGSTTYSVNANLATYLGSILIDGTNGQISCYFSYGQGRRFGVWNGYNRVPIYMKCGDPTASWAYNTNTIRESNGSSSNLITTFTGLQEETIDCQFIQRVTNSVTSTGSLEGGFNGIGLNSITATTGRQGFVQMGGANSSAPFIDAVAYAKYFSVPAIGVNNFACLESGNGGTAQTITWFGTETHMILSTIYRA